MSKPLQIISISALLASLILGVIYYHEIQENYFPSKIEVSKQERDLASAQKFLVLERPLEAAALAKTYTSEIVRETPDGKKWLEILTLASERLPDTTQLLHIFDWRPSALKGHEKGALLVAEKLVTSRDTKSYETLKRLFEGQTKHPSAWFLLDGDALLAEGRSEEAAEHLKSRFLSGPDETERLLRLALLHSNEHPKVTWHYLEQALKKDPTHPDIRLWRAHMLETSGKAPLAETEYLAAVKVAPEDPKVAESLADYYLRHHHYKKALYVLEKQLQRHPSPNLWIKTFALAKTVRPASLDMHEYLSSEKGLKGLVDIPEGAFWAESASSSYELDPSLFWLRVLQTLKEDRDADALTLLNQPPLEGDLGGQELRELLKETLLYRTAQELPKNLSRLEKKGHGSFADLLDHLKGSNGMATVFLAYGWNEAALRLHSNTALSDSTPEWIAPAMTQALFENRGIKEALAFAALQKPTPSLNLLLADLHFQAGDAAKGEALLKAHASESTALGRKAALKYAARLISKGEIIEAKEILSQDPDLENSLMGQELLARIALEEKNSLLATQIYEGIEASSSEAKAYLARKAYTEKDYRRAFSLTEKLLKENPRSLALRENLQKILNQLEKTPGK